MDETDVILIKTLADNADVTATELMPALNLSIPAINKRIARLKSSGTIRKVTVQTDAKLVGKPIVAFVMIVLEDFSDSKNLLNLVESEPDILECYAVTGEYDYLLKICASSIETLEEKLLRLKSRKVAKSHTLLTLCEHKFSPSALPD